MEVTTMETNTNNAIIENPVIVETPVAETVTAPAVVPAQTIEAPAAIPAPAESNDISVTGIVLTAAAAGAAIYGAKKLYDKVIEPGLEKVAAGFLRRLDRKRAKKAYEQNAAAAAEIPNADPTAFAAPECAPVEPTATVEADK